MSYYDQYVNATYGADYKTPDWWKQSFMSGVDEQRLNEFFAANPQYAEDFARITSGGQSQYSTDGTGLIKTDFGSMSPEAAAHYAQNPSELLAAEGFNFDPTLAYMNYNYGPGSIGITNPRHTNTTEYLQNNRWTPNGLQGNRNTVSNAGVRFGAGTQSYLDARGGGTVADGYSNKPMQMGGGSGTGAQGGQGSQGGSSYGGIGGWTSGVSGNNGASSGGVAGGAAGGYSGGVASSGGSASFNPTMNPYLQQMGDMLAGTMTNNWQRKVQPQIASQAIAAGGYGGSRQGVAEANSANDLNMGIGSALANLYGQGYGQGLNYDLGQQNLGLGYANLDRNINNDNLNWQLQGANFGLGVYDRMQQANQLGLQTGTQLQNTPLNYWNQFSQGANSIGQGYGTSTQSGGGNPLMGAIGGAQLGSQVGNWWNSQNGSGFNYTPTGNGYGYTYQNPAAVGPPVV